MGTQQNFDFSQKFWPGQPVSVEDTSWEPYAEFLDYVGDQLTQETKASTTETATVKDSILTLVEVIYQQRASTFEDMIAYAEKKTSQGDRKVLMRMLELAIRLSLTINVRCRDASPNTSYSTLYWNSGRSLDKVIADRFCSSQSTEKERMRVEQSFTAAFLVNTCGVRLRWSNNLADHLSFDAGVLTIYQHKICLIRHARYTSPIIPHSVLNEALQTMNLLFPFGDKATRELLFREGKRSFYGLGFHLQTPSPDLSDLQFWCKEMTELYALYRDPPHNWTQLFSDSRDKQQFATLWIAVLVLILTLVSIAFGTASTVYSIKQYNCSVKQYNLALAQACSEPGADISLPQFCGSPRGRPTLS
jgi:hypothetical protein